MLSSNFGVKANFAYDKFNEVKNSTSLPFESTQMRFDLQGAVNVGSILRFNEFTSRLGLLVHGGAFVSQFEPKNKKEEYNGGLVAGITPQIRLSNRFALNLDLSGFYGLRQDYNFDGMSKNQNRNLTSLMFTSTAGITYYIGKNKKHVDWASLEKENETSELEEARKRIADLEAKLVDTDKDGVLDFLDLENNSPSNAIVDSKGRVVSEKGSEHETVSGTNNSNGGKAFGDMVNGGFVNVFYDVNKDQPMGSSLESVYGMYHFMKNNPDTNIMIKGYADVRGEESFNNALSKNRAQNIYNVLVKLGISENRLEFSGQGEEDTNDNSNLGLQMARRVSFSVK